MSFKQRERGSSSAELGGLMIEQAYTLFNPPAKTDAKAQERGRPTNSVKVKKWRNGVGRLEMWGL